MRTPGQKPPLNARNCSVVMQNNWGGVTLYRSNPISPSSTDRPPPQITGGPEQIQVHLSHSSFNPPPPIKKGVVLKEGCPVVK